MFPAYLFMHQGFINYFIKSRINKYMNLHELSEDRDVKKDETNESAVKIEKASFSWSNADEPTLKNIDIEIKKKSLTAIVGSVGSGKSSLLSAMLGKKPLAKGQLILKGVLMSSISSKKRTKEFDFTTMIPQIDLFSFIFWRKLKATKKHFEII